MRFEPGPIPALSPDPSSLQPEQPQFQALTADVFTGLDPIEADLDTALGLLADFDTPAEFDIIDLQLGTVDEAVGELEGFTTQLDVDTAANNIATAQGEFNLVAAEAPAEIWQPVPPPQSAAAGSGPQPGVQGPTSMSIANDTAPGDTSYYSGDAFELDIQVTSLGGNYDFANLPQTLTRSLNGADQGGIAIGSTDQFGLLVYKSTFDDSSVGVRVFGLNPSGFGTNPIVQIQVLPGPRPGTGGGGGPAPLGVTLWNLTTDNAAQFAPGDIWRILVTGPEGQPVYLDQVKDGIDQGEVFVGSTDAAGSLVFGGTITAAQLGSYVESFRVGTARVPSSLTFTVV